MRNITKRTATIVVAMAVAVGAASVAYAYWTAGGTGNGSAETGTNSAIVVNQDSVVADMGPGDAPQNLSGDFDNANDGPVWVASVTAAIGTIAGGATCEATDYTLTNAVSTVNAQIPAGDDQGSWGSVDTPQIQFNNKGAENQDDCKNAVVTINYTIQSSYLSSNECG